MMVIDKVMNTAIAHDLIRRNMHIVIGLSGGPDSVCLFDVFCKLADEYNLSLHPVHINHKFRPGDAEEDQAYVENLCIERGWPCQSFVYDCTAMANDLSMTPEEAGRKARYESFAKVATEIVSAHGYLEEEEKVVIAVAQNANDQCETVLFRIMRGTGTDGLSGIAYKRYEEAGNIKIPVIRPLLDVTRKEIEEYCRNNNLSPRIDYTNSKPEYTRNRIRLELIPYMALNFNNNIIQTVNRLAANASIDKEYLWQETEKFLDEFSNRIAPDGRPCIEDFMSCPEPKKTKNSKISLFIKSIENLHEAIRFRVYNFALNRIGMTENITSLHYTQIEKIRTSNNPSAIVNLSGGFKVSRAYDRLVFYLQGESDHQQFIMTEMTEEEYSIFVKTNKEKSDPQIFGAFSAKSFPEGIDAKKLVVRCRQDGDFIVLSGGSGKPDIRKKLQDFFTDAKVPKMYRDDIKVLALGSEILWILPSLYFSDELLRTKGRFSARHKVKTGTEDTIIVLESL